MRPERSRSRWLFAVSLASSMAGFGVRLPADDAEIVREWVFDSDEKAQGWEAGNGISGLHVAKGKLVGQIEDPDAYLFGPPVQVPMNGLVLKVRWSCPKSGSGQCYFATDQSPRMGEDKVVSRNVPGGEVVETDFSLDADGRAKPTLTRFRLDPFNGLKGVPFEIEKVVLLRLPCRLEIVFGPAKSVARPGEPVELKLWLRHSGGRRPEGTMEAVVDHPDGADLKIRIDAGSESPSGSCAIAFKKPGVHVVRARVFQDGRETRELESSIVVGLPEAPVAPLLESHGVGLELLPSALNAEAVGAARLWVRCSGAWKDAGLVLPLVEMVVEENGVVRQAVPALKVGEASRRRIRLDPFEETGKARWRPELELGFEADLGARGKEALVARASLQGPEGGRLLKLAGPTIRRLPGTTGLLDRHAIFGGIEFLEPGWRSSSERAVGPKFASRFTPHPLKLCLPVMAVEVDGITTALLWSSLQEWAPGQKMPAATFASPDFLSGREDHLLQLFLPSVGEFVNENETTARRPFLFSDKPVTLTQVIHAGNEPVLAAARKWYEHFGAPAPPPAPHDEKTTYDLLARSYGETLYWPGEKGWRHHWFLDTSSSFVPDMAAELLLHSKVTGEHRWIEATGLKAEGSILETIGTLWERALSSEGAAEAALSALREDATYAYHDSPQVKEAARRHTGGRFDTLGEEGSTSLGTCVQGLLPLLQHVLLTGQKKYVPAVEKGLKALRRFKVPRGAQVWEVHQEIPDIRAAALAVEAFRIGYLVTGDSSYLDDALYWANAGLPFLYAWETPQGSPLMVRTSPDRNDSSQSRSLSASELFQSPRRQVNPYGTVPVLGTTYYVVSWFGVIVEWCGLEWAAKVLDLCDLRDDPILRSAAAGVTRSGLQQMFDREPWIGLYPDVWNVEGNWAGGALICPRLLVNVLRAGGHLPQALKRWTRRVELGSNALIVNGWGELLSCRGNGQKLEIALRFLEKERGEILVAQSPEPRSVHGNEKELKADDGAQDGFRYDPARKLLGARFLSGSKDVTISVLFR